MAQVNRDNFLVWDDGEPTVGLPALPWQYHMDRGRGGSLPIAVAGEGVGFYVNVPEGVFDQTIGAALKLDVLNAQTGAVAASEIEDVEKHVVDQLLDIFDNVITESWNPWAIAIWPSLPDGMYRLRLRGNKTTITTPETKATATLVFPTGVPEGQLVTVRVEDDPQFGEINLGSATRGPAEALAAFVSRLALAITNGATGYTASAASDTMTITANPGLGDSLNTQVAIAATSTSTQTSGTFSGGVDAITATNEVTLLTSSPVMLVSDQEFIDEHTTYCRFRHDRYFYGCQYDEVIGFYNQFRLIMGKVDVQPESEKEVYREATTGKRRTYQNYLDKAVKVETYYMTEEQHIAAAIMCEMDYVELNQQRYRLKSTYRIETDAISKVSKGTAEFFEEAFSTANRC